MPLFLKRISSLAILSTSSELRAAPDTAAHRRKVDTPRPVLRWQIVESQRRQAIADGDVRVRRFVRRSEKCRERGHAARRGPGQRRVGAQLRRTQGARHEPLERQRDPVEVQIALGHPDEQALAAEARLLEERRCVLGKLGALGPVNVSQEISETAHGRHEPKRSED